MASPTKQVIPRLHASSLLEIVAQLKYSHPD